jgi:hypothetical protein
LGMNPIARVTFVGEAGGAGVGLAAPLQPLNAMRDIVRLARNSFFNFVISPFLLRDSSPR